MATAIAMASYEVVEGPREMGNGIWIRFSVRRQRGGLIFGCTNLVWADIQKGRKFRAISKKTEPHRETGFSVFSENSRRENFPSPTLCRVCRWLTTPLCAALDLRLRWLVWAGSQAKCADSSRQTSRVGSISSLYIQTPEPACWYYHV